MIDVQVAQILGHRLQAVSAAHYFGGVFGEDIESGLGPAEDRSPGRNEPHIQCGTVIVGGSTSVYPAPGRWSRHTPWAATLLTPATKASDGLTCLTAFDSFSSHLLLRRWLRARDGRGGRVGQHPVSDGARSARVAR